MSEKRKNFNVGSIVKTKSGKNEQVKINNRHFKLLLDNMTAFYEKNLAGKESPEDLDSVKKSFHIGCFKAFDSAPDWVLKDIVLDLDFNLKDME